MSKIDFCCFAYVQHVLLLELNAQLATWRQAGRITSDKITLSLANQIAPLVTVKRLLQNSKIRFVNGKVILPEVILCG